MSSGKDAHLYGVPPKPRKIGGGKEISSSTTLSFTSQLSSLIANNPSTTSSTRHRSSKRSDKSDIFKTHNRNVSKRAAADSSSSLSDLTQKHTTNDTTILDAETWRRAQKKMHDKARLYAAMKRGDVNDDDEKYAVDFDRKWTETGQDDNNNNGKEGSSEDGEEDSDDEMVEYEDEFGRTRTGTRRDKAKAERLAGEGRGGSGDGMGARPIMPEERNIIYGDTIQAEAFDPEKLGVLGKMEELVKKRDRSLTPPPDEHFDSRAEVRRKGTGFFAFSGDGEERRRQMEELEGQRRETERVRGEREGKLEARRREIEKRREELKSKRGKMQADEFLDLLGEEMSEKRAKTGTDLTDRIEAAVENEKDDEDIP